MHHREDLNHRRTEATVDVKTVAEGSGGSELVGQAGGEGERGKGRDFDGYEES